MKDHLEPKPNVISQRYAFYKRDRRVDESVKGYVAELRKLSEYCEFGDRLDENLRDKLVCGLNDQRIQQKLLSIRELTLTMAVDNADAMEAAVKNAREIHSTSSGSRVEPASVNKLGGGSGWNRGSSGKQRECFRCESTGHLTDTCIFKGKECYACKKVGHIKKKCQSMTTKKNYGSAGRRGLRVNYAPI